jgi:hypothetical protein
MPSDAVAMIAVVILAFPMVCFLLSSPAFLLVGLDVPEVTQLLRGIMRGYFLAIGIAGTLAMVLLVVAGRPAFAVGAIAIAVFALLFRRWLLQRMDAELKARDAGVAGAVGQLRALHLRSMLVNAVQFAMVMASVPIIV